MEIIVTHTNADFDALASLVAASRLYPDAEMIFQGSNEANVYKFLETEIPSVYAKIKKSRQINLDEVTQLILVDTRQISRIGKFNAIVSKSLPIYIYDHHPSQHNDISGTYMIIEEIGATTTLLLEEIIKKGIDISPQEATLMALGIYQDTGSFTFLTTTPRDLVAVSYLISHGADLTIIRKYLSFALTTTQIFLLNDLLKSQKVYMIDEKKVIIATAEADKFVANLAILAHTLVDIEGLEVLFCIIRIEDRIHVIARSRIKSIDVSAILMPLGGGGHHYAASVTIRDLTISQVETRLLEELQHRYARPSENFQPLIEELLPQRIVLLLKIAGEIADQLGFSAYVVGGFVRDLLLKMSNLDIDIVIEGDGIIFAKEFAYKMNGKIKLHKRFQTAVLTLNDGFHLDITTARMESYDFPASLPHVCVASLREDLRRRDFTINAMAIQLNPREFGRLVDFFGGKEDLENAVLRVLHPHSFRDDPTRIFRGVRFSARHAFQWEAQTKQLIYESVTDEIFSKLSGQRVRDELIHILLDNHSQFAMLELYKFGVFKYIHPEIHVDHEMPLFEKVADVLFYFELIIGEEDIEHWLVYLLILLDELSKDQVKEFLYRLRFTKRQQEKILQDKDIALYLITLLIQFNLRDSELYKALIKVPIEVLVFTMAKAENFCDKEESDLVKKRIGQFLTSLRYEKICISGEDLKHRGIKPGPIYKQIKEDLLMFRLDGKVKTKEDELEYLQKM